MKTIYCRKKIKINCFGKLSIFSNGTEQSIAMKSARARELIAFLLTYHGEAIDKNIVCEALWMDKDNCKSRDSLNKLILKIKKMPIPFNIKTSKTMIQLSLDNIDCDIIKFEKLLQDKNNFENLDKSLSLHKGSLFQEENFNWICEKDGYYESQYMNILNCLFEHYKQAGHEKKANYYSKLIDEYAF